EDAKRPNREHESLVGEQTRIVNRMKAALSRLGIRGFNPKLKKAAERLEDLRTPEDEPIPPNTLAELRRDMERRRLVRDQIRQIEDARLERIEHAPSDGPHAMVRLLARVSLPKQKSLQYQGGSPKSFHYRAGTAAWTIWPPVAIRGRGCTGRSSLSC